MGHSRITARDIERACAEHGLRLTGQRRVIAKVVAEASDHPDVEELHRRAAALDEGISLSTVYRTMKLFEDSGIIARHDFQGGRARYEKNEAGHHDHLIDMTTGNVVEFESPEIEELQAQIARKLGFRLVHHRLELYAVPLDHEDAAPRDGEDTASAPSAPTARGTPSQHG